MNPPAEQVVSTQRYPPKAGALGAAITSVESAYSWWVLIASLLVASLSFGAVTTVPVLMKPMAEELAWSRSALGLAHALAMVGAGFGGLILGRLADRHDFGPLALLGALCTGLGLWLSSRAEHPLALYLPYALLVGAAGQGLFFGPVTANISRWFDRNRTFAMACVMCGQSVGGLSIPVMLRAAAESWGWRQAMASYGVFSAVCIGLCALVLMRRPPGHAISTSATARTRPPASGVRTFLSVCVVLVPLNGASFMVIAHLVPYGEESGLAPAASATLLASLLGVTLVSRLISGALMDRGPARHVLLPCALLIPFGVLILLHGNDRFALLILGALSLGFGYGGVFPIFAHLVRSAFPAAVTGTWLSAMFLGGFLAAATGSWLGGYLRDIGGDYRLCLMAAVLISTLAVVNGLLMPPRPRPVA